MPVLSTSPQRDLRIDFLRGLALLVIFIDHIPGNSLAAFTMQGLGLSDAAEAFVFISGLVCGMVYVRALSAGGWKGVWLKAIRRAAQVYVAYLLVLALAAVIVRLLRDVAPVGLNFHRFFTDPAAIPDAMRLVYAPGSPNVLILYVILLGLLPVGLWLHGKSPRLLVGVSLATYVALQAGVLVTPGVFREWTFNPAAWQLLFFIAFSIGARSNGPTPVATRLPRGRAPVIVAVLLLVLAEAGKLAYVVLHDPAARWTRPTSLFHSEYALPFTEKFSLGPLRLLHFLVLAYLCAVLIPRDWPGFRRGVGRAIVITGRHSLPIFCLGVLLSIYSGFVGHATHHSRAGMVAENLVGCLLLIGAARLIENFSATRPAPPTPRPTRPANGTTPTFAKAA